MKNLYFVQASLLYGDAVFVPYASGALIAYAFADNEIRENYAVKRIVYTREKIDAAIASFDAPYLVCFSNYVWSYEYNKEFARRLKRKWPDCLVLFGGHNIAADSPQLLEECAFMDFLIHNEGEVPFRTLLRALLHDGDLQSVPNLSFRDAHGAPVKTENRVFDVADFPSPYQAGVFDEIVRTTPYQLNGLLETNRGCPFGCLFCDWGVYKSRVRQFPAERVRQDIAWLARNRIEFVSCADANFGILERDADIVEWLIESKKQTGYPAKIQFCFTKGRDDLVFGMSRRMNEVGLSKGATLSMQTLDKETLRNIDRINPTFEKYCELVQRYNKLGIPTYTEILVGLPGETFESFCEGFNLLLKAGQHNSILVFNCEVLLNSKLGSKDVQEKYKIRCARTPYKQHHSAPLNDEVQEYSSVIVSTYSMTTDDWIRCNLFVSVLGCFHNYGVLQCFAVFLYYAHGVDYKTFYTDLLDWIFQNENTDLYAVFNDIRLRLEKIVSGTGDWRYVVDGCGNITWPYEEGAFLRVVRHLDEVYAQLRPFLQRYPIPPDVFRDLLTFQMNAIKTPHRTNITFELSYDLCAYFRKALTGEAIPLCKKKNTVTLRNAAIPDNWEDYARELVWYGKRGNKTNSITDFISQD